MTKGAKARVAKIKNMKNPLERIYPTGLNLPKIRQSIKASIRQSNMVVTNIERALSSILSEISEKAPETIKRGSNNMIRNRRCRRDTGSPWERK